MPKNGVRFATKLCRYFKICLSKVKFVVKNAGLSIVKFHFCNEKASDATKATPARHIIGTIPAIWRSAFRRSLRQTLPGALPVCRLALALARL